MTLYYDPLLDVHQRLPAFTGVMNTIYLAPQVPDDTRRLFDAALDQAGILHGDGPALGFNERTTTIALLVARNWGLDDLSARLQAGCEANYQPTWSGDEFWWGFGLDEPHPRGQWNALLAAAEATTTGAWTRFANEYTPYTGPELRDVDLDVIGIRQADWVDGCLLISTVAASATTQGSATRIRITGLDDPSRCVVTGSGATSIEAAVDGPDLVIELRAGSQALTIRRSTQ